MRKILLSGCLVLVLFGCGDRAKELFETAQFEERQFNVEHAQQLYREIIEDFSDSSYAVQARERLKVLEPR